MKYKIKVESIRLVGENMTISISGKVSGKRVDGYLPKAKLVLYFDNEMENRRIPFVFSAQTKKDDEFIFSGSYKYKLDCVFWKSRGKSNQMKLSFHLFFGTEYEENIAVDFSKTEIDVENNYFDCKIDGNTLDFQYNPLKIIKIPKPLRLILVVVSSIIKFLIGLVLVPWFCVEAVLSFFGVGTMAVRITNRNPIRRIIGHVNTRFANITGYRVRLENIVRATFVFMFSILKYQKTQRNRITFISQRRDVLSGNFEFVYNQMKDDKSLDIRMILSTKLPVEMSIAEIVRFCNACAKSKVIILDEYTPQIHYFDLKKDTTLIQLWHACGAFKTFGFTRLGKPMGSPQITRMHRSYDYVTVSSSFCKMCHSEGFGIAEENVVPTGIPRTDIFFDEEYRIRVRNSFYKEYPGLKDKKIILFAPTFRGMVKETAFYPMNKFNIKQVMDELGDEYAIIVKHHPFVQEKQNIPQKYKDRVIDLSDSPELNDLMFISDVIITDYSSLIFEASLLQVPMLFYVFDLEEYIEERDFYFDLKLLSPGKLVYTQKELIEAIESEDFETERIEEFKKLFFDKLDGKSTERVVKLIRDAMN